MAKDYIYSFEQSRKTVSGLTLAGIHEAANRRGGIEITELTHEERGKAGLPQQNRLIHQLGWNGGELMYRAKNCQTVKPTHTHSQNQFTRHRGTQFDNCCQSTCIRQEQI
ncbi:MAG: hypothetical protein OXM61_07165 [Candidatus Poribacteria bacterium]|nr:hypothetical protein [Candidatus Poribacteria bacterium]